MLKINASGGSYCRLLALALLVSGCGGGGGGGSSVTPVPPVVTPPVTPPPASMVPAAPATGAILYTDATVLRPLVDGAVWTYRGSISGPGKTTPKVYVNVVKQASVPQGGMTESVSNLFDEGADSGRVYVAGGSIKLEQTLQFTPTPAGSVPVTDTELNSPVLQNHQYTVLEKNNISSGTDADQDGKIDLMDVAAYRTVVGNETVNLPNMPAVTALRVDITNLFRVTYSSNGKYSDVVKISQSAWYAPGIGLVRQRIVSPTSSGIDEVADEVLVSWDGVNKGIGAMPAQELRVPAGGQYAGSVVRRVIENTTFTEHGVLRIQPEFDGNDPTGQSSFQFLLIDKRGQATKLVSHLNIAQPERYTMVRTTNGFAEISHDRLFLFDRQAQLLNGAQGTAYDPVASTYFNSRMLNFALADDGDGFLVLMHRSYLNASFNTEGHIVLRKFDYQGQPMGAETILGNTNGRDPIWPWLSVTAGQLIATWDDGNTVKYAVRSSPQAVPVVRQINNMPSQTQIKPLALNQPGRYALSWQGVSASVPLHAGLLLDGDFNPRFSANNTDWTREALSAQWGGKYEWSNYAMSASDERIAISSLVTDKLYPESEQGRLLVLADYPATTAAWSQQAPRLIRFQPDIRMDSITSFKQFVFDDRVVVVVINPDNLKTAVVWRR